MNNFNLDWHEESASDTPETSMPNAHPGHLRVKAVDELTRLVILVGYIWVVFELLSVNENILFSEYHLSYAEYAFAIINALVFARVLVTRNCMWDFVAKLFQRVSERPPSLWAANAYLSQETVVGSAHVQVVSAQSN